MKQSDLDVLISIPELEKLEFQKLIREYRSRIIRSPRDIVEEIFSSSQNILSEVKELHNISEVIHRLREDAYFSFLKDEAKFNVEVLRDISLMLDTPRKILDNLIATQNLLSLPSSELINTVKKTCGEYAGYISPYIYELSLSNTQSRRSRAGKTFEQVIYKLYRTFGYSFTSQSEIGKDTFKAKGLSKMVDSLLPGIEEFEKRRDKVIIGTMKTTLRERWQEVVEEINRTGLPSIYLLTMDDDISESKATQMRQHNVVLVIPKAVKAKPSLLKMPNIIDFESYFLEEIPEKLRFWKNQ